MPPTSIDGTDITGATIDGTDVQEITVDGDTVFSAGPSNLPVAYSNLIAWYPFDSAEYGGSNADDVTAIIGASGDDTAYDGTVNGATYQSSGGVTDINAGANSGAFDFDGSNDVIDTSGGSFAPTTFSFWLNPDFVISDNSPFTAPIAGINNDFRVIFGDNVSSAVSNESISIFSGAGSTLWKDTFSGNQWLHFVFRFDSGWDAFVNGTSLGAPDALLSGGAPPAPSNTWSIGARSSQNQAFTDGTFDDVRFYNSVLTNQQITDIYNNTKP